MVHLLLPSLLVMPYPWTEPVAMTWTDKASLSYVALSGNAQSQSLGFSNEFLGKWGEASLMVSFGGVRVNAASVSRVAVGHGPADYTVVEQRTPGTTSETYTAALRFDQKLSEQLFWFSRAGWDQNRLSGLQSRTNLTAGFGHAWVGAPATRLRMDLGLGYTREQRVFQTPGFEATTASWRLAAKLDHTLTHTSGFSSELTFTDNVQDARDTLTVWKNALTSRLNGTLALKLGLDLTYDNTPASVGVDLIQTGSQPPVVLGQVPVPLRKLDAVYTTSVVLTF